MTTQSSTFTMADIEKAVRVLRENNAPPAMCPRCKTAYYVLAPADWEPGQPLRMRCEELGCGHEWIMMHAGGVMGRVHPASPLALRCL